MTAIRKTTTRLCEIGSRSSIAALLRDSHWLVRLVCGFAALLTAVITLKVAISVQGDDLLRAAVAMFSLVTLIIAMMSPVLHRRVVACAARSLRHFFGLALAPMARVRRSQSAAGRTLAALDARAAVRYSISVNLASRVAAHLLARLGAITVTAQPRFTASLVAGFAAHSAA